MTTDDERRAVAERLRERASYYESMERDVDFYPVESAIGLKPAVETAYTPESVRSLADLIDPGELKTTCIAEVKIEGERLDEVVNRAIAECTGIDRDALLRLADEIHELVENQEIRFFHAVQVHESTLATIERRIREACGEVGR